jgi:hypothetical protein
VVGNVAAGKHALERRGSVAVSSRSGASGDADADADARLLGPSPVVVGKW